MIKNVCQFRLCDDYAKNLQLTVIIDNLPVFTKKKLKGMLYCHLHFPKFQKDVF